LVLIASAAVEINTDPDFSEFDEQHREFFIRPEMELYAIISLAHGIDPSRFNEAVGKHRARYSSLKAARSKGLIIDDSDRPELDFGARVRLSDLLLFLDAGYPEYGWLGRLAVRWKKYRPSDNTLGPCGSQRTRTKPHRRRTSGGSLKETASTAKKRVYRRWPWDDLDNELGKFVELNGPVNPAVEPEYTKSKIVDHLEKYAVDIYRESPSRAQLFKRLRLHKIQ
jgi:hypothetical protein